MAAIVHKQTWGRKYLIPSLIAVAILYSFMYNYILFSAVHEEMDPDVQCSTASGANDSPHCLEVRLFRDWHEAETVSDESASALLAEAKTTTAKAVQAEPRQEGRAAHEIRHEISVDEPLRSAEETRADMTTMQLSAEDEAWRATEEQRGVEGDSDRASPLLHHAMAQSSHNQSQPDGKLAEEAERNRAEDERWKLRAKRRQEEFDGLEEKVRSSLNHSSISPWAKGLMDDENRLESKMESHENHYRNKTEEASENEVLSQWQAHVDRLDASIHTALHAGYDAPWAKELAHLKHRLQFQLDAHMRRYSGHEAKVFEIRRAQLDKLEEALHAPPSRIFSTPWDKLGSTAFEIKQMRVRLDLEMSTHALTEQNSSHQDAHDKIAKRMTKLESGLTDLTSRHHELKSNAQHPTFLEKRLHWSSVNALSHSIITGIASQTKRELSKSDVRHLHWEGIVPRVACITAISYSRHTKARMMYFIDNFKLQDYEGPRQLVLVYHYNDTDAAELVQKYADGVLVKGVAARGSDFPSNSALRYGVWSADADVIARWEFDAWHDPSRLSMQIRAMAATSRPACYLGGKGNAKAIGGEDQLVVEEPSLVGERSWMKVYWQPYHKTSTVFRAPPPPAHVVTLDMDNARLSGNTGLQQPPAHASKNGSVAETSEPKAAKVHEWSMEECLNLDNSSSAPQLTVDAASKSIEGLGHDLNKAFNKLMAKRHDITQKLQLLCLETTMASDMKEHIFKRQHVEQMIGIRSELDKHIAATIAFFSTSKDL